MNEPDPRPRFHLAIGVDNLDAATTFYGEVLGCSRGRIDANWIDWNLFGHQVVTHRITMTERSAHNSVDGHDVPIPHFGLILSVENFQTLAERLRNHDISFVIEPYVRFRGEIGEQWTMFF